MPDMREFLVRLRWLARFGRPKEIARLLHNIARLHDDPRDVAETVKDIRETFQRRSDSDDLSAFNKELRRLRRKK